MFRSNNLYYLISFLVLFTVCSPAKKSQTIVPPAPNYQTLIWSDEFDTDGPPDSLKWRFESGFVRNEEAQWYQANNAVCKNGFLVITGRKERRPNPGYMPGSQDWKINRPLIEYTSASVVMRREHAFRYGKLEVRAMIDAQTGLWPAIWTLGIAGEWPSNGEVDVMEYYDDRVLANFAYAGAQRFAAIWDGASKPLTELGGAAWANRFHTWELIWNEKEMQILVDGFLLNTTDINKSVNLTDGRNPFRQPHYVLLNLALGGQRGGSLAETRLPSEYQIDYVRIYQ